MSKSRYRILDTLYAIGVHIGHSVRDSQNKQLINFLLDGTRDSFLIFDVRRTSFFLKRALVFLYNLSTHLSFNFFCFSNASLFPIYARIWLSRMLTTSNKLNVFLDLPLTRGMVSNYKFCFFRFLALFCADFARIQKFTPFDSLDMIYTDVVFRYLLIRVFYVLEHKIKNLGLWKRFSSKFKIIIKVIVFFRMYKYLFRIPDVVCAVSPTYSDAAIMDFVSSDIPCIGLVDTTGSIGRVAYPIPSNDDSVALLFFFFKLFFNVIKVGNSYYYDRTFASSMTLK